VENLSICLHASLHTLWRPQRVSLTLQTLADGQNLSFFAPSLSDFVGCRAALVRHAMQSTGSLGHATPCSDQQIRLAFGDLSADGGRDPGRRPHHRKTALPHRRIRQAVACVRCPVAVSSKRCQRGRRARLHSRIRPSDMHGGTVKVAHV
jgi:hypothetical protein